MQVDSAATHNYHPDSPADPRSQEHAAKRGYDLTDLRARQIQDADFETFDLILAMDWDNLALIQEQCPPQYLGKVRRLTEFGVTNTSAVVPDPDYGGQHGLEDGRDWGVGACGGLSRVVRWSYPKNGT